MCWTTAQDACAGCKPGFFSERLSTSAERTWFMAKRNKLKLAAAVLDWAQDPRLLGEEAQISPWANLPAGAGGAPGTPTPRCCAGCAHRARGLRLLGKPQGPEHAVPSPAQTGIPDAVAKPLLPSQFLTKLQKYPRVGEAILENVFMGIV